MKISKETLAVLDNFSGINPSITLRPGNVIRVGSPSLDMFAQAVVRDDFPLKVKIFNLKKLLSVLSLFKDDVDVEFNEKRIVIKGARNVVEYTLSDVDDGRKAQESPDKEPNVPAPVCTVRVTADDLSGALKSMSVLELPNVTFSVGADGVGKLSGTDDRNSAKDKYTLTVGDVTWESGARDLRVSISRSSVKFLPRDYVVSLHDAYVKFQSDDGVAYWIPALAVA